MNRKYYLELAEHGLAMPIAADLVLNEYPDPEEILLDGVRLGRVLKETASRFGTPLAVPHMNLELEKTQLAHILGAADGEQFRFDSAPSPDDFERVAAQLKREPIPELQAQFDATAYIAERTELVPVGMSIGPFSLMTKLVADPITPVCLAGTGLTGDEEQEIRLIETVLELAMVIILNNIQQHIDAGARAVFIAEPAANTVYFSPNQIENGSDIFDRYVVAPNRRIKQLLDSKGVDLIFHCCGELTDHMVARFGTLDPAILSLGSSRRLWEDARLIPETTVLFGNLPSRRFYSDDLITVEDVIRMGNELIERMRSTGHPFILGSECDILSVPGCHDTIMQKAEAIARCGAGACQPDLLRLAG